MDDQVERLKKLKAGKERLAAFQKKKTKKKKKNDTSVEESDSSPQRCPSQPPSPECGSPAGAGAACPPVQSSEDADPPCDHETSQEMTNMSSSQYLNETGNTTDGVNQSLSETERQNLFHVARSELHHASSKISELEESVLGKQRALERLGLEIKSVKSENERLKQAAVISNSKMNSYDHLDKCKPGSQRDQVLRIQELENAVVKRDELLWQLSSQFQTSRQKAADKGLQQVCSAETQKLAQQVQLLQLQLQQAGEKLNGQMKQHCVSSQALQDAKNEILNLQLVIQQKDEMMSQLVQRLSKVNEDYVQLQSSANIAEQQKMDHAELLKQLNALKEKSDYFSRNLDDERQKNQQLEKQLKDEKMLMHNAHDEPIAVEDHIRSDSSSVTFSQPDKESLIQELNCEKSKNQALDIQLQNQFHLIQKFVSLYRSGDSSEEFNNVFHQLTELGETISKNYSSTWSHHLPNTLKPSSLQDFESDHQFSHKQQLDELLLKLRDLQTENQDLSTEMAKTKSSFEALLATKDELEKRYRTAEESQTSMAETVKGYLTNIHNLKEENASLSASVSNFEKLLSTQTEQASHGHETEALLNNELALLKSEKDTLNLSLQKKDEDIQVLSEKLELSHQEVMNLKNMRRTLEQELSGSQDENKQLKEQLNSRKAETDQLRTDEKVFTEKLAASQAEINKLKSEIESLIDESSKHQKTVGNETVKLNESIADYRQQIAKLVEENSQQVKKAQDQESRLTELDQQITSLTNTAKSAEMDNERLLEENNSNAKKTISLVQYFSHLQSLVLSINNPAEQGDLAYQFSVDDDPEKFGAIVNEVSSTFSKHRDRIEHLEYENHSLTNACIQEKEDVEKRMKEKSNEIIISQQTIEQTKQTIEALQSENQKLTDQLQEAVVNARKNESELERLQAQLDTLQMDEAERSRFKELDQLLAHRDEEIERLKTEMDSLTRNLEKENENQRQVISELNEQNTRKEEIEEQIRQESKDQKSQIDSLQRLLQDEAEEVMRLKQELSSVGNMKESSSLALQAKESEIQNLVENVATLNSQHQNHLQEIETLKTQKDVLVSELDQLKSECSSLESQFQKEKSALDQMQSEKNRLENEKMSATEELAEKQKLISEMEGRYKLETDELSHENDALSRKLNEMDNEKKHLMDQCANLGGQRELEVGKIDAELSELKVLLQTEKELSSQKLKEVEEKLKDAEKQSSEWERKAQQLKSEQFSAKANIKKQIEKITKEKEQHKAKVEELLASSKQKEEQGGELTTLLDSKTSELKQVKEELVKFQELWNVEKKELSSQMKEMSSQNEEMSVGIEGHLEELKKLQEANKKLSEEKSKLSNSVKDHLTSKSSFKKQIEKITKEKDQHKAKVEELLASSKQKEEQGGELTTLLDSKTSELKQAKEELVKLQELWKVEKAELLTLSKQNGDELASLLDSKTSELKQVNDELVKFQELWNVEKEELSSQIKEMSVSKDGHLEELKKLKDANKKLSEEKSKLSNSVKDHLTSKSSFKKQIEKITKEKDQHKSKVEELLASSKQKEEQGGELTSLLDSKTSELKQAEEELVKFQELWKVEKAELLASSKQKEEQGGELTSLLDSKTSELKQAEEELVKFQELWKVEKAELLASSKQKEQKGDELTTLLDSKTSELKQVKEEFVKFQELWNVEKEELSSQMKEMSSQNEEMSVGIEGHLEELKKLQEANKKLSEEKSKLSNSVKDHLTSKSSFKKQIEKITKEKDQHKAKVEELLASSKQKEEQGGELTTLLDSKTSELKQAKEELVKLQELWKVEKAELLTLSKQNGDELASLLDSKTSELEQVNDELVKFQELWNVEKEELSSQIKEMSVSKDGHLEELKKLKDANKKLSEEKSKLSNSVKDHVSSKSNLKKQIEKITKEKEQHEAKFKELLTLSEQKDQKGDELASLLDSKTSELKQVKEELVKFQELWNVEKEELSSQNKEMSVGIEGHLEELKKLQEANKKLSEEKSKLSNSVKDHLTSKSSFKKQIEKITKEKDQHKAKVEELLASSKQKEEQGGELTTLLDSKTSELKQAKEELVKLQELWKVEKAELSQKLEEMSKNQNGQVEEVKKLKAANTKLSEEKSKLGNSLKELEKKMQSKEKSLSDKNNKLQNTIKELKQKSKDKNLSEENTMLQNSLKELKQKSADSEKALLEEKSKLQDSFKELEQSFTETEKSLSEENSKLKDSIKELNQALTKAQKVSGAKREKNSKTRKETAPVLTNSCAGAHIAQDDQHLSTEEIVSRRTEEIESELVKKQEFELEALAEKYEQDLKYARMDILQGLADEKENYERDLDQRYTLKVESLKAEVDRSFIKSLQKVRSELEHKHREEMNELRVSLMKECLQMAPKELENKIGNLLQDMEVKNQTGGLLEKYQAKKLAESRDSLLQQIVLLNNQYEQIQDEQFPFSEKLTKKPMASSPRDRRKFDTLPQDIESASRSLVEISRAKGCYDEEKSCPRLDCQGYRKRYEIALKILTEKGLTSFDNMSEKSSFEVDSLDGSTSVGDQQRDELSQDLQDEYHEIMERTMTEPMVSNCFTTKHGVGPQCPSCIALMEEKLSLKKRLSIQLELFGKERYLLQNRCEHLNVELENALLNRDQVQKELTIVKEVQQRHGITPVEIEFTELKVKLANTEDQVSFLKNKVSQNEIERQELKAKINDLFVKLIDQQHYIDTLEEEYSRSRSAWHHKGTMTCEDHTSILPVMGLNPGLTRRHSDPSTSGQYILERIGNLYKPRETRISKSAGNLSPVDDINLEPAMWLPKIPRSQRDTSPDSLNKSPYSDHSSQLEDHDFYKNYCQERAGSSLSEASTLLTGDAYIPNCSTPQKLSRAARSSPSLTTLGEFHESERMLSGVCSSDKENHLPFCGKHLELIDEVAELKRSLSKTKEQHIQETAILKEFVNRLQQFGSAEKPTRGQSEMMGDRKNSVETVSLSSDVVDLRQKVSLLRETCRKLTEDNGEMMKKLYDQECLVMKTKYLGTKPGTLSDSNELDALYGKQLLLLQKHRDELSVKLSEERSLENQISELVAAKAALEQTLCQEREMKEEIIYKKGFIDSELTSLKSEYGLVMQEQLRLEQVIRDKDNIEKGLQAEKFKMEQQLSNISCKLGESEKILKDMQGKESPELSADDQNPETNLTELRSKFSKELYDAKSTIEKQNIQRLEGLRKKMEEQHTRAVELLRQQLRSDFKLRESRLEEHHSSHIASLHTIHGEQLESLKDEYEAQMEELKQELHKERFKHAGGSGSTGSSSSNSSEFNGLSQDERQKQEAQILVLDKLQDVLSAPQWQQLQTVLQEIKRQHQIEVDRVKSQCEDEIDLRVKAARLTVEQVYKSQSELMKASLEEKKQGELAELRDTLARYHNEEISRRETDWSGHLEKLQAQYDHQIEIGQEPAPKGAVGTLEGASLVQNLTKRLNEEHKKLIEAFVGMGKPTLGLKWLAVSSVTEPWMSSFFDIIVTDQDVHHLKEVISKETNQREQISSYQISPQQALHTADSLEYLDSASNASHDGQSSRMALSMSDDGIRRCLEEQKEEIMFLRSKILKEYEQLLKARTDSMVIDSHGEISSLQDEIEALQQQYEIQIASLKQGMPSDVTADSQDAKNLSRCLDTDQRQSLNNLLEYFKSKVHSIESRFNNQITGLKFQIESDLSASFGEASCEMDDSFLIDGAPLTSTSRSSTGCQNLISPKVSKQTSSGRPSLMKSADQGSTRIPDKPKRRDSAEYVSLLEKKDMKTYQEEITSLRQQLEEVITSKTFLQREKEELIFAHTEALSGQQEDFDHKHKMDIEELQCEFDIQLQVELKKQAVELLEKYQAENQESDSQNHRDLFERELVKRTMTAGHFDSYDASDTRNIADSSHTLKVPEQKFGLNKSPNQIISEYEARIAQMQTEFERKLQSLRRELTEANRAERKELTTKHQTEMKNLQKQLVDLEEKYETVMEGLRTGDAPEVAQMMRDKYDTELELAKALMQQEFDESLEGEQSRIQEQHEQVIEDFLSKKTYEMRDLQRKYDENLTSLQKMLQLYEQQYARDASDGSEPKAILTVLKQQLIEKDNKMAEEEERHRQEMERLRGQYEEKLARLKYADQTSLIPKDIDTIKSELDAAHQAELKLIKEQLSSKNAKMIENLEKQHKMQIEELEKQHKVQLERLRRESADNGKILPERKDVASQEELLSPVDQTTSPVLSPWSSPSSSAELDGSATPVELMTTRSFADVARAPPKLASAPTAGSTLTSPEDSRTNLLSKNKKSGQFDGEANSMDSDGSRADTEASDKSQTNDKHVIIEANQNLLRHLSNLVRSYISVEDTINKKLQQVLSGSKTAAVGAPSPSGTPPQANHLAVPGSSSSAKRRRRRFKSADRTPPSNEVSTKVNRARSMDPIDPRFAASPGIASLEEYNSSGDDFHETSKSSSVTDEGLVLSQQFSDSIIFNGPTLDSESAELITDTGSRLQSSIMRLLEMMEETTQQLLESKTVQQELLDTLKSKDGDVQNLNVRLQEMSEQLKEERNSKEHLALELHKSQGLVNGFSEERDQLSTRLKDLEDKEAVLTMENETLRNKIHDLQMSESEVTSLHQEVQRQQTILYDNAGREHQDVAVLTDPVEWSQKQGLLDEICQLNDDKRHMMQLLQQNQDSYEARIRDLIASEEDIEHKYSEMLDEKRQQIDDLRLQLESVERQLKANKQFLNEQAQEREQEREEFQREIHKWKTALQQVERQQNSETRLKKEVEELSDQLENRISSQSEFILKNEKLERDLRDKELTAQELKNLVSQIEQELDDKNTTENQLREKISQLETQLRSLQDVNNDLSCELKTSLPRNEEKITDLESQLEDQELVYREKAMSLDEELKKAQKVEEELSSEKTALEQQVCDLHLQVASLKNQLDDYRQRSLSRNTAEPSDGSNPILDELRSQLQRKEEEVLQLTDMVDKLELELVRKDNKLSRLEMAAYPREPLNSQSSMEEQENSRLLLIKEENQKLKSQVSTLQRQVTTAGFSSLAQQLLDEKNEQIDQLKEQMARQNHYSPTEDTYSEDNNCLKEELEKKTLELEEKDAEICSLKHMINSLQLGSPNDSGEHFPGDVSLPFHQEPSFLEDSMSERTSLQQELSAVLTDRDNQIDSLKIQLVEKEDNVSKIQMESELEHQEAIESLREALQDKDITLDEMYVEVDDLHAEVANLTEHQTKLQEDFDTVQAMLESKEKEIESLTKELTDLRSQIEKGQLETDVAVSAKLDDVVSDLVVRYEVEIEKLRKKVKEKENIIDEKLEENYTLNEKVEELGNSKTEIDKIKMDLQEKEKQLSNKISTMQGMEKRIESSNKVIRQLQEREDHWHLKYSQTELQLREREEHLQKMQNELLERDDSEETVRQRLIVAEQQLSVQQQNIQALQMQLVEREKRFKEYNETSSELKDTISSLEEEKEQMAVRMSTKDQEIPKLQEQLVRLQKIVHDQSADISRREKSYMTLVKMHQEKDEMISMEEGRTIVLRAEVEELQNELLKKEEELGETLKELRSLKSSSEEQGDEELTQEVNGSSKTNVDSSALQKLVSQQKGQIKQLQSQLETLTEVDQQKSGRIAQLEAKLEEHLSEIKVLEKNLEQQKHLYNQMNKTTDKLQEELQETWKSKLAGELQIDELRQRLFKIESDELKVSPSGSLDDSMTIQSKFTDLWSEIQKRETDVERLEYELSDVHQRLRSQEAEIIHTHLQTAEDGGHLSEEINSLLGKLQQLESELETKNKLISRYEFQLNKKDDVLQDMQVKLDRTMSTYHHNEQQYHTLLGEEQKQASMAEGRIVVLRSEVEDLQNQLIHKENELWGVKDHLMETQGQLIDRAQEMTRLCKRRSSSDLQDDDDDDDAASTASSLKTVKEQENAASKVTEDTVKMLEEELKTMRSQLHSRTKQLEEANESQESASVVNTALPHDQLIDHVNQVQDELRITRSVLERLCKANSAQQATLQEREQQVQQLQADLATILAQQKAALAAENKTLQKAGNITWPVQSFESPEYHNVGPMAQSSDNRGAQSAAQDVPDSHPPEQNFQDRLQVLLNRMHREGLQNLSLAELQFIRQYASPKPNPKDIDITALRAAWEKERQSLLSAIQALKELLSHEQQLTSPQWQSGMSSVDWRSKILQALSHVFAKERDVLLSELHSYVLSSGDGAMELSDIQRLENKIQTQQIQQKAAMEQVVNADRQSLLSELQDCTAKIGIMELQHHEEKQELSDKLTNLERQMSKREEQSQRHIQLLEYRLQQSRIVHDDLQSSLEIERKRAAELSSELTKAKTQSLDMHNECTNLQVHLAKVKDALEQEHSRYLSLMAALEEEKVRTAELTEQLDIEKHKVHDLEVEVENLNGKMGQERDLEFQHLHLALENERDKWKDADDIAREKQAENMELQQELETERLHGQSLIAKNEADLALMKSRLMDNDAYIKQLISNFQKEKALNVQLKQSLDKMCVSRQDTSERDRASITDLQGMLDTERSQLTDLQQQMETLRMESQTKVHTLTSELQATKEKLEKEKTKFHKVQVKADIVENQHNDIERQLSYEKERAIRLQAEKHTLALEIQNVRQREKERYVAMENDKMANNKKMKEMARFVDNNKVAMHQNELEVQRLQEKVQALETDLQNSRLRERQLVHEMEYSKLRSPLHLENLTIQAHLQQQEQATPKSDTAKREKMLSAYKSQLENVRQQLEFNGIKIQDLLNKSITYVKSSHNSQSSEAFATLRPLVNTVAELLTDLHKLQISITLENEGPGYPHLSAMVNQRTLQHNRELINSIFTLSEEKLGLREQLLKKEERICDFKNREVVQQTQAVDEQGMSFFETSLSVERMKWEQERTSYELALRNAEKKIEQLQRNLRLERSQGLAASGTSPWVADKELVQSLYQKYLRAESFRKALIYQKNYLLVLLGGFQDSEQTVLALLAQMGATENSPLQGGEPRRRGRLTCRRPLTMFRSVTRVVIAISRMKFLVRKLQQVCATPLPAALMLGPPALNTQRTGYTASESSSTSSTTSSSSRLTSNKITSPQDTSPRLALNNNLIMQAAARARSPPNSNHLAMQSGPRARSPPNPNHLAMQGGARARSPPNLNYPAMQGGARARSPTSSSPPSTGRLLPIPGLPASRNQFLTNHHGLKNTRDPATFNNTIQRPEEENGSSLETPNTNSAAINPKQLRFTTPPTKEFSHSRGSLQRVPAVQQLSFEHSNPPGQRPNNDSPSSSSEGSPIANPCPSNGDIPNDDNYEDPNVEHLTPQEEFLHCIERVQNRVDQLRHPPQIERQRHRRKYDSFHKNLDL